MRTREQIKKYQQDWRSKNKEKIRLYMREWCRSQRKNNPEFRKKQASASNKRNKEGREKIKNQFGNVCAFPGCQCSKKLNIHHDHKKQKKERCCRSLNGCSNCRLCLLCTRHNILVGFVSDSLKVGKLLIRFLERYHS